MGNVPPQPVDALTRHAGKLSTFGGRPRPRFPTLGKPSMYLATAIRRQSCPH